MSLEEFCQIFATCNLEATYEGLDYKKDLHDWFVEYFLPEMKIYCAEEPDYRILLILDNASAHVLDYVSLSENITFLALYVKKINCTN
jgi:hypothetical protein